MDTVVAGSVIYMLHGAFETGFKDRVKNSKGFEHARININGYLHLITKLLFRLQSRL